MAEIKPFGALRFGEGAGKIEELVCPPYDIISEEERAQYLKQNQNNIIRLELPKEGESPYAKAGETLRAWLENGILKCDKEPGLYVYEEVFSVNGGQKSIKGLVCRVKLEEFSAGVVLPHEETLSKAKEDRFQLMQATGCNFSSIYSLYFDKENKIYPLVDAISQKEPLLRFSGEDGILHTVWRETSPEAIAEIQALFAEKKLYIADGHHRYETALRYKEELRQKGSLANEAHPANDIMMTLVNMEHPGLVVFPTHRIVRGLEGFSLAALLEGCKEYFEITPCGLGEIEELLSGHYKAGEKAIALYGREGAYVLRLSSMNIMAQLLPGASGSYQGLDVNVLHVLVLERLLGIDKENMANQKNLAYTRDFAQATQAVESGEANLAVFLNPTKVEEIADVAGAGEKMPQKSTYFYPKLITGHLMNKIL